MLLCLEKNLKKFENFIENFGIFKKILKLFLKFKIFLHMHTVNCTVSLIFNIMKKHVYWYY